MIVDIYENELKVRRPRHSLNIGSHALRTRTIPCSCTPNALCSARARTRTCLCAAHSTHEPARPRRAAPAPRIAKLRHTAPALPQCKLQYGRGQCDAMLQVFQPIRVMMLEFSCFLENYLWPNFDAQTASYAHVISIIIMVPPTRAAHPGWSTNSLECPELLRSPCRSRSEYCSARVPCCACTFRTSTPAAVALCLARAC